ncbi:hypothetical protein LSAT2_031469 [Lamellibrachia satsuma]|nr:hypothetical protein LSAT2_031469 [Lamellibrachia satsuma]
MRRWAQNKLWPPLAFTGPDELWDHQVLVNPDPTYVGYKQNSPELTTNVDYLWRMPKGFPHPLPKSYYAGQINWGIPQLLQEATNNKRRGDKRIKLGLIRQRSEDFIPTQFHQEAWYAGPNEPLVNDSNTALYVNNYKHVTNVSGRHWPYPPPPQPCPIETRRQEKADAYNNPDRGKVVGRGRYQ